MEARLSLLKTLTFTKAPSTLFTPEQRRRNKMVAHLQEQLAIAQFDAAGKVPVVMKKQVAHADDGKRYLLDVQKRLRRWWQADEDGKLVLKVRWSGKLVEFEKGKDAIIADDIQGVIAILQKLIHAVRAGELDVHMQAINRQRAASRRRGSLRRLA